ncbi:hypothetical protein GGI16_007920 [Coemansia sp. S142-1]|nr:hypothetical protein GGI16_007920 [Coemansia sp. S142-1]
MSKFFAVYCDRLDNRDEFKFVPLNNNNKSEDVVHVLNSHTGLKPELSEPVFGKDDKMYSVEDVAKAYASKRAAEAAADVAAVAISAASEAAKAAVEAARVSDTAAMAVANAADAAAAATLKRAAAAAADAAADAAAADAEYAEYAAAALLSKLVDENGNIFIFYGDDYDLSKLRDIVIKTETKYKSTFYYLEKKAGTK